MKINRVLLGLVVAGIVSTSGFSQEFYFGADLSYLNEMNDCGVEYAVEGEPVDGYKIFADNNCGLVRLRKWHTPAWHDTLNAGDRYSDINDIERGIARAKDNGMAVLLDFHLSDTWADPSKQIVPVAWAPVVDDLEVLKDSLYNYLYATLMRLDQKNLVPEMVQIGNETNKGILQSQEDNDSGWILDWDRNSALFNAGIKAVRDFSAESGKDVQIMVHVAGPTQADYLFPKFIEHGVVDFDIMGVSYYWAWHKPVEITDAGAVVSSLKTQFPEYDVMIVETGYIWTWESNDDAPNIIGEVHPDYSPPSPSAQKEWLIDMTTEVMNRGAMGVVYWEPAWVSSPCWTPWGQGSHQEHATYFDFDNNLIEEGGVGFMTHDYGTSSTKELPQQPELRMYVDSVDRILHIAVDQSSLNGTMRLWLSALSGDVVFAGPVEMLNGQAQLRLPELSTGIYIASIAGGSSIFGTEKIFIPR